MMRKTIWALAVVALLLTAACSREKKTRGANDFAIEGTISGAADKTMLLQAVTTSGVTTIDSVRLEQDGQFAFYSERPKSPGIYRLVLDNQFIYLSIDSIETVQVNAAYGKLQDYTVKGSDDCLKMKELNKKQADLQQTMLKIEQSEDLFPGQIRDSLLHIISAYKKDIAENYLMVGPNKAYAVYALFQTVHHVNGEGMYLYSLDDQADLWAFASVATSWKVYYPNTEMAKQLEEMTLRAQQKFRQRNQGFDQSKVVESGLFDIELPDALNNIHRLTDLNGQVVVLNFNDFHAAESGAIILALRELYAKYHEQGLEIYQVGVRQDAAWWRQAVNRLPWVNVLDATGYAAKLYNAQALGEFFIIDRNNVLQQRVGIDQLEQAVAAYL